MCVNMTGTDKKDSLLLENHKHHVVLKNVMKLPLNMQLIKRHG
jgi:hypothetical protein